MATENRQSHAAVTGQNAPWSEPWRMDFYHALRLLEACANNKPRIGTSIHTWEDVVRLRQEPFAGFAPTSIAKFKPSDGITLPWLSVYFLGLLGPNGPLPFHFTEYAIKRIRHDHDETFARFLDIFNNRILSLFYRARAEAEPVQQIGQGKSDHFSRHIASLAGLGLPQLRDRDAFPDSGKLFFAGRLSSAGRNPEGLAALLSEFFGQRVAIKEFVGGWLKIAPQDQYRLGSSRWQLGYLGVLNTADSSDTSDHEQEKMQRENKPGIVIGSQVWDCQHMITIKMGPVPYSEVEHFLPGGSKLKILADIVRNYCGDFLRWKLNLIILKEEVPAIRLGPHVKLGWTTWVTSRMLKKDPDDFVLDPQIVSTG